MCGDASSITLAAHVWSASGGSNTAELAVRGSTRSLLNTWKVVAYCILRTDGIVNSQKYPHCTALVYLKGIWMGNASDQLCLAVKKSEGM